MESKGISCSYNRAERLDQEKEKFLLNVAEVTKKIDTETSVDNFEIPNQLNAGDKVDVCISTIDSEKYSYRYVKN